MRLSLPVAAIALLAALMPAAPAAAQCSDYVIQQMQRAGIPSWEIQRRCGRAPGAAQQTRTGTRCEARARTCSVAPAPIGSPCWCTTPLGSVAGRITG
ncbi:hypothetical protein [Elioraea sp.]|jgi:hypothetical protein|uniref:hypothetical protein n=1 Tax=Elioraea sp. TaxID=2185103 RepID=UPI003F709CB9